MSHLRPRLSLPIGFLASAVSLSAGLSPLIMTARSALLPSPSCRATSLAKIAATTVTTLHTKNIALQPGPRQIRGPRGGSVSIARISVCSSSRYAGSPMIRRTRSLVSFYAPFQAKRLRQRQFLQLSQFCTADQNLMPAVIFTGFQYFNLITVGPFASIAHVALTQ